MCQNKLGSGDLILPALSSRKQQRTHKQVVVVVVVVVRAAHGSYMRRLIEISTQLAKSVGQVESIAMDLNLSLLFSLSPIE